MTITTWRYEAYGLVDSDIIVDGADPDEPPFAGISAARDGIVDAIEVAVVGQPDGTAKVVITGADHIDITLVDDRASTGGSGSIRTG